MANLINHPGMWLRDDAAAALARLEAKHGVIGINRAGVTEAEQNAVIARWDRGGAANRPPYLYAPARPATASQHVAGGGRALDTSEITRMLQQGPAFGWFRPYSSDPVHFEYDPARDPSANPAAAAAPAFPLPAGWYFGPRSGPVHSVSGYVRNREDLRRWQQRMADRGWQIGVDGLYGPQTEKIARAFQLEKGLTVDGKIGPATWAAAWIAPVT